MPGFDILRRWFERLSYWQLRLARHSFFGLATLACAAAFWELFAARRDLITRLSIATAYPSLFLSLLAIRGRPWLYFVDQRRRLRHDLFGVANHSGLIAALLFLLLLAISNDLSLRRLGTKKWKSLQRWTYIAAALTTLHAAAYQHIEKRQLPYEILLWTTTAIAATFQILGWWQTKFPRLKSG